MLRFIKKYWPEILVVGILAFAIFRATATGLTWMMVDSDGPEYVMDAKFFLTAHHTSAPLFLLLGRLFLLIPFGADYWKMSLMSGIFTLASCLFIYLIVKQLVEKHARFYGLLASVIFGGAALVIAQAVIVETYAVVTFFSVAAYYLVVKNQWYWASAMIGAGIVVHHLMLLTYIALFIFHKELRPFDFKPSFKIAHWKPFAISCSFLAFYIYMPLSIMFSEQLNMWGNTTFLDFFKNNIAVFNMLVGQLPIYELPKRILETFGILGISLGLAMIPVAYFLIKQKTWKSEWLFLFGLPVIYMTSDLAVQVAKYAEASIAWGAIMAVMVLSRVNWKYTIPIVLSALTLLVYNSWYFDIKHLDPNLSAQKFYDEQISKMQDGDVFVTMGAWEWIEVFLYNKETGHKINPICIGILASEDYQNLLRDKGIKVDSLMTDVQPGSDSHDLNEKQVAVAMSIVSLNDRGCTSRSTDPATYGAEIVPARGNEHLITQWVGQKNVIPQWRWKPDDPRAIISGSIEVEKWNFILQSTYSCMFFAEFATFGLFLNCLINRLFFKKKEEIKEMAK